MSLFNTIDDLFEGIVFFFYSLVATLLRVLLSPVRGPQRLVRARAKPRKRQISSQTALFVSLLCTLGAFSNYQDQSGAVASTRKLLSGRPDFGGTAWWPYLLTALAVTVFVDSVLRIVLGLMLRRRRDRRDITLASVEYALVWPCALACAFVLLAWFGDGGSEVLQYTPFAFALLGPIPPMFHLARGIKGGARVGRRPRRPILRWAESVVFSTLTTIFMVVIAGALLTIMYNAATTQQRADGELRPLEISAIKCAQRDRAIKIIVIVTNPNAKPAQIDGEHLQLAIGSVMNTGVRPEELFNLYGLDSTVALVDPDGSSLTIVPANAALRLSGSTRNGSGATEWGGDRCALAAGMEHDEIKGLYVPSEATNGVKWAVVETGPFVPWDRRHLSRDINWAPALTADERRTRARQSK